MIDHDTQIENRPFTGEQREIIVLVDGKRIVLPAADYEIKLLVSFGVNDPDRVVGAELRIVAAPGQLGSLECSFAEWMDGYEPPQPLSAASAGARP